MIASVALGLLGCITCLRRAPARRAPTAALAPQREQAPGDALHALRGETERRLRLITTAIPTPRTRAAPPALPALEALSTHDTMLREAATALGPTFCALYGQRDYFDHEAVYREVFAQLAEDPTNTAAAGRLLTDPDFLRDTLVADRQAVSRVFALHFLRHRADAGDAVPLIDTTRSLFASLAAGGETVRGQYRDLEVLLRHVLEVRVGTTDPDTRPDEVLRGVLRADGERRPPVPSPDLIDAVEAAVWVTARAKGWDEAVLTSLERDISALLRHD